MYFVKRMLKCCSAIPSTTWGYLAWKIIRRFMAPVEYAVKASCLPRLSPDEDHRVEAKFIEWVTRILFASANAERLCNSLEDKAWMSMRGFFLQAVVSGKKTKSHNLLPLQKREDRGKGNVLRQSL